jgi:hypothetical protein
VTAREDRMTQRKDRAWPGLSQKLKGLRPEGLTRCQA